MLIVIHVENLKDEGASDMSNSYDSLKQVVGSVVNYDEVVAAIGIALDVLDEDNFE